MAPVIHEWTYEAMVADQLAPQDGLFAYDTETQEGQSCTAQGLAVHGFVCADYAECVTLAGKTEAREHMLSEADPLWVSSLMVTPAHCHALQNSVNDAASY